MDHAREGQSGDGLDEEFRNGMPFVGGRLWIDLLNTVPLDADQQPADLLGTEPGVDAWLDAARLDVPAGARRSASLRRLIALRDELRRLFETLGQGAPLGQDAIGQVNQLLDLLRIRVRVVPTDGAVALVQEIDASAVGPAGLVAHDFAQFVCDYEPARLKHCANPACSMVFYDQGKNAKRRWCTMSVCGNRDKVARFRARRARERNAAT